MAIVFLSYYGNDGKRLIFGLLDYLGVGISVGFCVVIPLIFFTYLCDGNILIFVSNNNTSTTIFNSRALVTTYFWMLFYRTSFFRSVCCRCWGRWCSWGSASWPTTPTLTLSTEHLLARCWRVCVAVSPCCWRSTLSCLLSPSESEQFLWQWIIGTNNVVTESWYLNQFQWRFTNTPLLSVCDTTFHVINILFQLYWARQGNRNHWEHGPMTSVSRKSPTKRCVHVWGCYRKFRDHFLALLCSACFYHFPVPADQMGSNKNQTLQHSWSN